MNQIESIETNKEGMMSYILFAIIVIFITLFIIYMVYIFVFKKKKQDTSENINTEKEDLEGKMKTHL